MIKLMYRKTAQSGFLLPPVIILIGILLTVGIATVVYQNKFTNQPITQNPQQSATPQATSEQSSRTSSTKPPTPTPKPINTPSATPVFSPKLLLPKNSPSPIPSPTPSLSSVKLDSISPTSGKVGDVITITGSGFGKSSFYYPDPTKFKGGVSFYGPSGQNSGGAPSACTADWDYSCWRDNQIKVKVPGIKPGFTFQIEVTSSDGQKSNRVSFEVLK